MKRGAQRIRREETNTNKQTNQTNKKHKASEAAGLMSKGFGLVEAGEQCRGVLSPEKRERVKGD